MQPSYDILIGKLDAFVRKYYQNQLIRGSLFSLSLIIVFFLAVNSLEYFGEFDTSTRTVLFYLFLISVSTVIIKYVIIPFAKIFRLGSRISNEHAASIIGNHFRDVEDKLINILQLKENAASQDSALLLASIDQKAVEINPVPFKTAINFWENKKYLRYAILLIFLISAIAFIFPQFIISPSERLINHQTYYKKAAPFSFNLISKDLRVQQNEDFELRINISGKELPKEVYIVIKNNRYRLKKEKSNTFSFLFKNNQKTTSFKLFANNYHSKEHTLNVLKTPTLLNFIAKVDYPKYTAKKSTTFKNQGDLTVPDGSQINWILTVENTDSAAFVFGDNLVKLKKTGANSFSCFLKAKESSDYKMNLSNPDVNRTKEEVWYQLNVIKDEYPSIEIDERRDSTALKQIGFYGKALDDYGLTKLTFNHKHKDSLNYTSETLNINESFFHFWDFSSLELKAGDELTYFFQVWDNDEVNGNKSTKSTIKTLKTPTKEELSKKNKRAQNQIKSEMENSLDEVKKLQEGLEKMKRKLTEKKDLDWEDRQTLKSLINQQQELEKQLENVKQKNAQNNAEQNEYKKSNEELLKKQQQIEDLFESVMTDEMKKLFEELEKLMEEADKKDLQQLVEQMELSNEDIEKELDRTLELFKQLEFEQNLQKTIDELNELAKQEESLRQETEEKQKENNELKNDQENIKEAFEKIKEELNDLHKQNEDLEQPNQLPELNDLLQKTDEQMKNSIENLQNNKTKKASENQQNAKESLQQMAQQMRQTMDQMQQEANQEDIDALRQLLENLVQLSFDQEGLLTSIKGLNNTDPKFFDIGKTQKKLELDAQMIEDSLFALSKRNPQIEADINREINKINQSIEKSLEFIQERQTNNATVKMQYSMTSINNLALMLDEIVQQMQQQMSQQKFGQSSCSKPGKKPGNKPGSMKSMQQQLSKQIEEMKKGMNPGQNKPGSYGSPMSKKLAQLAAEQEALRQQIQEMAEQMGNEGNESGKNNLNKLKDLMEENERDLVNKQITNETIKRQEEIMSRLLEHENAEREREFDEKREGKESKNDNFSNPKDFLEYKRIKEQEEELLRTVAPEMNPFYKKKVNSYFQKIK